MEVVGNHMFLVNAGSNSVSMFSINPSNPLDIKLVGRPVSSVGEFPLSLCTSKKTGNVCVLSGGKLNGVQCYQVDRNHGLKPFGKFHSLGLNLTTPPVAPLGTVSQVLFSEDGSKLRVSVKGFDATTRGYLATWDVAHDGTLSSTYTKAVPTMGDGIYPFGMTNIIGSSSGVMVTDPALGLTVFDFSRPKTTYVPLVIAGQMSTCWAIFSKTTNSYWLTDSDANKVYEVAVDPKSLKSKLLSSFKLGNLENPGDEAIGSVSGKEYLYTLAPFAGSGTLSVFSLKKGGSKLIQTYDFGGQIRGIKFNPTNLAGVATYMI